MPEWGPLPEDLDPAIREFTCRLRRLVDSSGLSVPVLADRTGFSRSSWERYLAGRLPPPREAMQALAVVTGAYVRHLEALWEPAERAWARGLPARPRPPEEPRPEEPHPGRPRPHDPRAASAGRPKEEPGRDRLALAVALTLAGVAGVLLVLAVAVLL